MTFMLHPEAVDRAAAGASEDAARAALGDAANTATAWSAAFGSDAADRVSHRCPRSTVHRAPDAAGSAQNRSRLQARGDRGP